MQEHFEYDKLNRLLGWKPAQAGNLVHETSYLPNGNIEYKTGIGEYKYVKENDPNPFKQPHAIKGIENLEGYAPSFKQNIRYNDCNKVESIAEGADSLRFAYGVDRQRFKTFLYKNGSLIKEKHFAGNYEVEITNGKKKEIHYIQAPTGLTAVIIRSNNTDSLFYVCTDHLGSIIALTDSKGKVLERHSYDAWGRDRNPDNWDDYNIAIIGRLDRGYTGHEHLREFGLINMNARLYDPILGRFLSPDPYVQVPEFSQSFNRYLYCINNPLKFVDPDGEIFWLIPVAIGAVIGAYSGGVVANDGQFNPIKWDYSSGKTWGYMLGGAAIGGVSGALGTSIAVGGGFMSNTMGIMGASYMNSVGMAAMTGQTPVSVSFGFGSYDFTNGKFRSIFDWKDLSTMEKIG